VLGHGLVDVLRRVGAEFLLGRREKESVHFGPDARQQRQELVLQFQIRGAFLQLVAERQGMPPGLFRTANPRSFSFWDVAKKICKLFVSNSAGPRERGKYCHPDS